MSTKDKKYYDFIRIYMYVCVYFFLGEKKNKKCFIETKNFYVFIKKKLISHYQDNTEYMHECTVYREIAVTGQHTNKIIPSEIFEKSLIGLYMLFIAKNFLF